MSIDNMKLSPREVVETECDRYNFETPGKIQSHGAMLVLHEPSLNIVQLSQNTQTILGIDHKQMVNQPISAFLDAASADRFQKSTSSTDFSMINPLRLEFKSGKSCDAMLIRHDGFLIAEIEPVRHDVSNADTYQMAAMQAMERIQGAVFPEQLIEVATNEIRELTDFDRVMYYKFDEEYNGQVVAEATVRNADSFMGLHFPASDIPHRVRQLYMNTKCRYLPDLNDTQIPLFPEINPVTRRPLDMTMLILRSVAPTHIEYMRNLGINSSMSFRIVKDGKMIGMFACHHYSGRFVPYVNRLVAEQVVEMFVAMLDQLDDDSVHINRLKGHKDKAISFLQNNQMQDAGNALLSMVNADGVAIAKNGNLTLAGYTPTEGEVKALLSVVSNPSYNILYQEDTSGLLATSRLTSVFEGAERIKYAASGLIAIPISRSQNDFILWFRPERVLAATWAGNPDQALEVDEKTMKVSPRKSFAAWQKSVENTSESWKSYEIQMATELRNALI
ncbi:MAG: GAF domain-containing protein [Bernardetiaceae bacterium]|nr:GAF domain-containing protein [Bernardetiaceae bacterium]